MRFFFFSNKKDFLLLEFSKGIFPGGGGDSVSRLRNRVGPSTRFTFTQSGVTERGIRPHTEINSPVNEPSSRPRRSVLQAGDRLGSTGRLEEIRIGSQSGETKENGFPCSTPV